MKLLFVLTFWTATNCVFSQTESHIIYFDKKRDIVDESKHSRKRIISVSDSLIIIKEFYKTGKIYMTGTVPKTDSNLKTLQTSAIQLYDSGLEYGVSEWYNIKGNIFKREIHDPFNSPHSYYKNVNGSIVSINDSLKKDAVYVFNFRKNGIIKDEGLFVLDDLWHGKWIHYSRKGKLFCLRYYKFGEKDGLETYYYSEEGTRMESTEFKNGQKHGTKLIFDVHDNVKKIKEYRNNERIK